MSEDIKEQKTRHANQLSIFNPLIDGGKKILVVWAGGIWSDTVRCLAKTWFNDITVVDFDEVENHNVASQFYKESQLGILKVEALKQNVLDFSWVEIKAINGKYEASHAEWMDIVIMAVDNMDVRKEILDTAKPKLKIIDGRMGWEAFLLYTFDPVFEKQRYLESWFPASEADPEVCTEKSVCYNTSIIWWFVTKLCVDIAKDKDVQFLYVFDIKNYSIY
jgi:molybdopterin/thiamine biosynthesis adenylyltransferase